ncbi:MAG: serine hydrolase domain-containing protein, partial [Planctomycetota bacterium]
ILLAFSLALTAAVAGCSTSTAPTFTPGMTLADKIEATRRHLALPGAAVAVYRGDEPLIDDAFGVASLETEERLTTDHAFRVASLSKPVVATVLLQLVDEGAVSLDDPVSQYIEGVPAGDEITLRMLAQHTSGLRNYIAIPAVRAAFAAQPHRAWTRDELLRFAFDFGPHFRPDEDGWMYSNTNYLLLGEVIEQVEGAPLGSVIDKRICVPLGLADTYYSTDPAMPSLHARGYQMGDQTGPKYWVGEGEVAWDETDASPSMWHAAGAMVSTLDDVRRLLGAVVEGELVSERAHAEQTSWRETGYTSGYRYGLGLVNYRGGIGHNGMVPGYQATAAHDPDRDVTVVVLANMYSSPNYEEPANAIYFVVMRHLTGEGYAPPGWSGW